MKLYKHIPNALTCGNLVCGCLALIHMQDLRLFIFWMLWALFFDFVDGLAARLLKAQSELGKQLDSLADMVSFGLVPGIWMYEVLGKVLTWGEFAYIALLIPIGAALRLAKFNIDARQSTSFRGLPTPAAALFFISLSIFVDEPMYISFVQGQAWILIVLITLIVGLMVSDIRLFSLKFEGLSWEKNAVRYLFLLISGAILFYLYLSALPFIILLYILLSLIYFGFEKKE